MIQNLTYLKVLDNSGVKKVSCIKILKSSNSRYANIGDLIVVSVKIIKFKKRFSLKISKGEVCKGIVIQTKFINADFSGNFCGFFENSVVLINLKKKLIGTRIFSIIPKKFRYTKFMKLISLSYGIIF